jgi:branched-chain amino acid transport system ATP-binding protein
LLDLRNVNTFYGISHVLRNISLSVDESEIVAILGRNGAGKTTLLKSIMNLVKPRSGQIIFEGKELTSIAPHRIPKLGIAYVPQGRGLFPELTVHENLLVGVVATGKPQGAIEAALQHFPVLNERLEQTAGTLSGGEQQMLAIGRALALQPKLLIMDEPTEGLMPTMVQSVIDITRKINSTGVGILIVEQKLEIASKLAERMIIMENGEIKLTGISKDIVKNKGLLLKYLGIGI